MNLRLAPILTIALSATYAEAADYGVLIRAKPNFQNSQDAQIEISDEGSEAISRIQFDSKSAQKNFLDNIPEGYEAEPVVTFKADDLGLIQQAEGAMQSDPLFGNQWSLVATPSNPNQYGGGDIDALRAWSVTTGGPNIVVYVMDSGIDNRDPDLSSRITSAFDAINPGQFPFDQNGHGSHVSSIIAAKGENAYGMRGVVSGDIEIAMVRFLDANNAGDSERATRGVQWMEQDMAARRAANPNVRFISSNSWGGGYSQFLEQAMQRLSAYDYLPITSAGNHSGNNDATPYFPCNFRLVANTCVGATDILDVKTSYSGFGPRSVHLFAPGHDILGVVPGFYSGQSFVSRYEYKRGTSQAVPHVAGAAALVWAANPELTALDVQRILVDSVDVLPAGDQFVLSAGRLNAYRAVLMATGADPSLADRPGLTSRANQLSGGAGCTLLASSDAAAPRANFLGVLLFVGLIFLVRRREALYLNASIKR